jgi:small subunit ribosomal protein S1
MSYARLRHPSELLKVGDEIEVRVLKVDFVKDRVSLGLKQLSPDPWTLVDSNYHVGDTVEGRVTKLMNFGAFVQLAEGIEGLIPISEMSWTQRVHHPRDVLKEGDAVRVAILAVDAAKHKVSLSLKALGEDPWKGVAERYQPEQKTTGVVTRITNFGAFVQLEDGIEGLVHISELSDRRVRSVSDVVEVGKVVEARILNVDAEQRRISLSLKDTNALAAGEALHVEAAPPPKKDRKRPLRGGLTW